MKSKHCSWCDNSFNTNISYQIYCSPECREAATKEKIAERYRLQRIKKRGQTQRKCRGCGTLLSMYNDETTCQGCSTSSDELAKVLKEIRGIANGKIEL
jgi:hypothetical protein